LGLGDISRDVEFVKSEVKHIANVKTEFFEQPTNGISYIRIKANLKNVPEHLRQFVPMFEKFFDSIGTKHTSYDKFDNKILSCTNGLSVSLDTFGDQE